MKELNDVAGDIIGIKFEDSDTLQDCMNKFYDIMRKHGIKEGTPSKNGRTVARYEWTMCFELFKEMLKSYFTVRTLLNDTPEDLKV